LALEKVMAKVLVLGLAKAMEKGLVLDWWMVMV
jgi:hypothetical protein